MKRTLFSALALIGMIGAGAITSHAEDNAEAVTEISANVISGGVTIETDDAIDFGSIAIGGSAEKMQIVDVFNLTGGPVNTTVKLNEELNSGVTLAGTKDSGLSPNIGTNPIDINLVYSPEKTHGEGTGDPTIHSYLIDWVLSASNYAQGDPNLSRTIIFTASPNI